MEYDELGRIKRVHRGLGATMSSAIRIYDKTGNLAEVGMQKHAGDTQYLRGFKRQFDTYGRLVSERDLLSDVVIGGNELWNQRRYEYHAKTGLPTKLIEREIEQVGEFGVLTGAQNHVTRLYETLFEHDLFDRLTRVEHRGENNQGTPVVDNYKYDSLGALVHFEDTMGAELEWLYDGLGGERKRTERGINGGEITTLRDVNFTTNVVTRTDAEGRVSRFEFDLAGRLKKQVFPGGSSGPMFVQRFEYDAASQLTWMLNGNDREIVREYDNAGRLKVHRVITPAGPVHSVAATREEFDYNIFGSVKTLTTKGADSYLLPVVTVEQAEDAIGRLQWERFLFAGSTAPVDVTSIYQQGTEEDLLVRRGLNVQGTPAVSFHLDALGRTWGYGDANTPGASSVNVSDFIARYRFVGGRVRERQQGGFGTNPNNWLLKTDAGWDPLPRLTSIGVSPVVGPAVPLSTFDYTYDDQGHVTKRKRDRVGVAPGGGDMFQLDEYDRLDETKLGVPDPQFGGTFANATSFQRHVDYSPTNAPLDKAQSRHLVRETTSSGTTDTAYLVNATSHRYDSVGGVPLIHDGEGNLLFDGRSYLLYDFKNRLSEVWQYVPADGEEPLQASGSMARSSSGSRDARYLVPRERLERIRNRARNTLMSTERMRRGYADVTGRMALANQEATTAAVEGNLTLVAVYGYDPYNRRVSRYLLNQAPLYSTWDGWREVAEYRPGSTWEPVRAYVWGGRIDELIRYSRNNALSGQTANWVHYHPQQDHQDSVDLLVDKDGIPREKYEYDPFGAVRVFQWDTTANNWGNVSVGYSAAGNPYTFTGRRLDVETGLMYYRNRYYSPPLGRFVTGDPIGLWGDVHSVGNPYAYGGNSPAFLGDPMGLQVTWEGFPPGGAMGLGARFWLEVDHGAWLRNAINEEAQGANIAAQLDDMATRLDRANEGRGTPVNVPRYVFFGDQLLDMVHVMNAASLAKTTYCWVAKALGASLEGLQKLVGNPSGYSPEDPPSNDAGADMGGAVGAAPSLGDLVVDFLEQRFGPANLTLEHMWVAMQPVTRMRVPPTTGRIMLPMRPTTVYEPTVIREPQRIPQIN